MRLQNYKSMPHVFPMFPKHPSTNTCYKEWARFINEVTSGEKIETALQMVNGKGIIENTPLDLERYHVGFTKEQVLSLPM